ncbi:MAG: hypothetical protein IT301_06695 [Dehalococcoidia bacterium]|nr:hypothetical protein [Dehalococcoidia bacterium]
MDQYLRAYAEDFLCDYSGPFPFLNDLQRRWNPRVGLSKAQARGVMNCVLAEVKKARRPNRVAPQAEAARQLVGTYTVIDVLGEHRTLRFTKASDNGRGNNTWVKLLIGPDNYMYVGYINGQGSFKPKRENQYLIEQAIIFLISADQDARNEAGMAYALESGNCFRCGRQLTVPASIHRGLGPDGAVRVAA